MLDPAVGTILHPAVDVAHRAFVERGAVDVRREEVGVFLQERRLHREAVIVTDPHGGRVSHAPRRPEQFRIGVERRVEFPEPDTERGLRLGAGCTRRAVREHREAQERRGRREQSVLSPRALAEEGEREGRRRTAERLVRHLSRLTCLAGVPRREFLRPGMQGTGRE